MKNILFIFFLLLGYSSSFSQVQTQTPEEKLDEVKNLKIQLAEKESIINALRVELAFVKKNAEIQIKKLRGIIETNKQDIAKLEETVATLKQDTAKNQKIIRDLTTIKSNLATQVYNLNTDMIDLRQNSDVAISSNEIAKAEQDNKVAELERQVLLLTNQLGNVIDRVRKLVIFNGQAKSFEEDVLFYETKTDDINIALSEQQMTTLRQFIQLANKMPDKIKIIIVGKYVKGGNNTENNAEERAKSMGQLLRNNQLNVPIDFDTEAANNNANYEKIGVSICVKKTW